MGRTMHIPLGYIIDLWIPGKTIGNSGTMMLKCQLERCQVKMWCCSIWYCDYLIHIRSCFQFFTVKNSAQNGTRKWDKLSLSHFLFLFCVLYAVPCITYRCWAQLYVCKCAQGFVHVHALMRQQCSQQAARNACCSQLDANKTWNGHFAGNTNWLTSLSIS